MFDFAKARHHMVEGQIRTNEVTDPGIVSAMSVLPREQFVPVSWQTMAYADREVPAAEAGQPGADRYLMNPMVLGKLIRAAEIAPHDRVLHIGAGTGYGTAILARMASAVLAVEENEPLAEKARRNLWTAGVTNATVLTAPLTAGCPDGAPFDVIIIEGAVDVVPDPLADQLAENGRLVTIVGSGRDGLATVFRRTPGGLSGFPKFDAATPRLPGFEKPREFVF